MKHKNVLRLSGFFALLTFTVLSCSKEETTTNPPLPAVAKSASFVEEFDTVGNLVSKGWVFKNNSFPIGQSGWRQGRYEAATSLKFAPVTFYGFPAYSAHNTPNDFVSCDITAGNDINGSADMSAWLISPQLPMKNGDSITFYTRSLDDANYLVYTKDRMQVRANFTDGTSNVGGSSASVGSFSTLLRDINSTYVNNAQGGYPQVWTRIKIVLANIPGDSVRNGRFAFRYMSTDAGTAGGSSGANNPSVVGIDSLAFGRR
jgi:hypothetical protein